MAVTGDATYTAAFDTVPLSEYTYQVGDRVKVKTYTISYCPRCSKLLTEYTATITGIRGALDGKRVFRITRDCCNYKSSEIETSIVGLA